MDAEKAERLLQVEADYDLALARIGADRDRMVAAVRDVAERFRPYAKIFVGGVPMIAADMMAFVRSDLVTFGTAILAVMAVVLWLIFRSWKWVFIPLITCSATATLLLGVLAGTDWRMTVISSNSVAVLLIVTLSLSIHLVVRYRELQRQRPDAPREQLSAGASKLMMVPCLYTAMTTIVAFTSFVVAGLQPVIDFGWMMTTGIFWFLFGVYGGARPDGDHSRQAIDRNKPGRAAFHHSIRAGGAAAWPPRCRRYDGVGDAVSGRCPCSGSREPIY